MVQRSSQRRLAGNWRNRWAAFRAELGKRQALCKLARVPPLYSAYPKRALLLDQAPKADA